MPTPGRRSDGEAIAQTARELGLSQPLLPWQRYVVEVATERLDNGRFAYDEVLLIAPRRSGKTFMVKALTAHRAAQLPALIMLTAQTGVAAVARWKEIANNERGGDGLLQSDLAGELRYTHGTTNERLSFACGSVFQPFAPTEDALHGADPDLVFVDELWSFPLSKRSQIEEGYRPAWSVKPGQAWLMSAAGTSRSGWLKDVRARGRRAAAEGRSRGLAIFEWGVPERVHGQRPIDLPDDELVALAVDHHPRRGYGLDEGYLAGELERAESRTALDADEDGEVIIGRAGWLRAYASIDADDEDRLAIPADVWNDRRAKVRIPGGARVGVGVAVDDGRREATVAAAWRSPEGLLLVETVRSEPGVRWAASYAAAMPNAGLVAAANQRGGRDVVDAVEAAGGAVLRVAAADLPAAASRWMSGITEAAGSVRHDGSPGLAAALRAAELPAGRSWVSRSGEAISAVQAHTLAVWAADHLPAEEPASYEWAAY